MALTGFYRTCADRSGGVRAISLARASAVEKVTFDAASRSYSAVMLAPGHSFETYQFREEGALFSEEAIWEYGAMLVTHTLRIVVDPVDAATAGVVQQLSEASRLGGMVAVVETGAGERLLVGYSEKFGLRQPLRLSGTESSTGVARSDQPVRTIVLRSVDCVHALPFTGELP